MALVSQNFSQALQVPFSEVGAVRPRSMTVVRGRPGRTACRSLAVAEPGLEDFVQDLLGHFSWHTLAGSVAEVLVDVPAFLRTVTVKLPT